jgi:hypothetical protein
MKFSAKANKDIAPLTAGQYAAIVTTIVDLGFQQGSLQYEARPEIVLGFELPLERFEYRKDGVRIDGPRVISRRFRASMHRKAGLRLFIEAWHGHFPPSRPPRILI